MAAADVVAPFHDLNTHNIDKMEFAKKLNKFEKAPVAPASPDGADMPMPSSPAPSEEPEPTQETVPTKSLPQVPIATSDPPAEVQAAPKPTLPVPSMASRKSRMEKKVEHEAESRKASIRRLASRAFEKQTGKTFTGDDMSQKEWDIYNAEVKKSEEILDRKQAEEDAAVLLENNIKYREGLLQELNNELAAKIQKYQLGQDELAQVTKDFEAALKDHVATIAVPDTGAKSSKLRMQEEKEKKALKAAWRRSTSDDPVTKAKQRQFAALEEITGLKARVEELRKELGRMMGQAQRGKSSNHRMREEKEKKEDMKRLGIEPPKSNTPIKIYKKEPIQRSHQQRMLEEQAKKAELRKQQRMSLDVNAMVGRPRSETTSF